MKNTKADTIVEGFWQYLKKGNNLNLVPEILKLLENKMNETVATVVVTSSESLTKKQEEKIISIVSSNFGTSKVKFETDKALIGGIKVKMGDTVLDLSLQNKLNSLAKSI